MSPRYTAVTSHTHGDDVVGRGEWQVGRRRWGAVEQNAQERFGSVNIEPTICNGHLPYPWERRWRLGRGEWEVECRGSGVGETERLGMGRFRIFVFTIWLIILERCLPVCDLMCLLR